MTTVTFSKIGAVVEDVPGEEIKNRMEVEPVSKPRTGDIIPGVKKLVNYGIATDWNWVD